MGKSTHRAPKIIRHSIGRPGHDGYHRRAEDGDPIGCRERGISNTPPMQPADGMSPIVSSNPRGKNLPNGYKHQISNVTNQLHVGLRAHALAPHARVSLSPSHPHLAHTSHARTHALGPPQTGMPYLLATCERPRTQNSWNQALFTP